MARVSKRGLALQTQGTPKQREKTDGNRRYKAGIYARLSSCQNEKKNESLETQVEIAKRYIIEFNEKRNEKIELIDCYMDIGKTGSNFDRDEFKRLMQDIRLGDIDCVIVKDLSRFGRNYLEAGNYLEKIFPFLGVRFIAVSDGYDTGEKENENKQISSEIKNLVNDMYAKDFSKKAKLHLKQRRQEGSYVGGPPPYGYQAVWEGRIRRLIPDENTKEMVRYLYRKFVETGSYTAVANDLNRRKINPPAIYKKTGEVYFLTVEGDYKGWDKSAVERLLGSDTYIGRLVQGKTEITARKEENRIRKKEEEWIESPDTHEPLISEEEYQKVQGIRAKIRQETAMHKHPTAQHPIDVNIFDRVLYCGVCGKKMTRSSSVKTCADGRTARREGYFCCNSGTTKTDGCPESNRISRQELTDVLFPLFRFEFAMYPDKPARFLEFGKEQMNERQREIKNRLKKADHEKDRALLEEEQMYIRYREGSVTQAEYVSFKMMQQDRLAEQEKRQAELMAEKKRLEQEAQRYLKAIPSLLKLKTGKELTKEMVEALVEKIFIYPGKRIEVHFQYTDEMQREVL